MITEEQLIDKGFIWYTALSDLYQFKVEISTMDTTNEAAKCTACGGEIKDGVCQNCGKPAEGSTPEAQTTDTPTA